MSGADAVARRPLPRGEGQEPARAAPRRGARACSRARCSPTSSRPAPRSGRPSSSRRARLERRRARRSSPTPAAARAQRCAPGSRPRRSPRGGAGPFLVVNADLPCVTAARPARARGRGPRRRARARRRPPTGRPTRSRSPRPSLFVPLYGPGSAARFAALAPLARASTRRTSSTTSTRSPTSNGVPRRLGPCTRGALASLRARGAPREGRRRSRAASAAPASCAASSRVVDPGERHRSSATSATTSRCSACTSRPTSTASSTRSPGVADEERGWGRAEETLERPRDRRRARRRGLVPPRRPRPRPAPRAHASCCARGGRSRRSTARLAAALGLALRAPAGDRRSAAHVRRDAGRDLRLPGVVRRPRPPRRGRRGPLRRRARGPRRRPGCSRRSRRPT